MKKAFALFFVKSAAIVFFVLYNLLKRGVVCAFFEI